MRHTRFIILVVSALIFYSFVQPSLASETTQSTQQKKQVIGILPSTELFDPLLADPRWPHFSASVQSYQDDEELGNVGSVNMGTSFALLGWRLGGEWQIGLQAGVFSIFDLDKESDLVNADYLVGIPVSVRLGPLSAQARILHQSSHLGDEYLLRKRPERINLSYEKVDLLLSLEIAKLLRIYGGGGQIIRSEPEDLEELSYQLGIELTTQSPLFGGFIFPIAALDLQAEEETDWEKNYSLHVGFELRGSLIEGRRLQVLFEYYNGHSPNGQFFVRKIEYYGGGIHFYF